MFRKKTAITLMSVMTITAAFLSGCGNSGKSADSANPSGSAAGSASSGKPVEFSFYFTGSQNVKDLWDTIIPMFEKQTPDVKVKPVYIPSGTGASRLMTAFWPPSKQAKALGISTSMKMGYLP